MELLPGEREAAQYPIFIIADQRDEDLTARVMKTGAWDFRVKSEVLFTEVPHLVSVILRDWRNVAERAKRGIVSSITPSWTSIRAL